VDPRCGDRGIRRSDPLRALHRTREAAHRSARS
jgi:hypothetical protein